MIEVHENIFVGNDGDCFFHDNEEWVVVHACKSPCHQKIIGYKKSLPQTHENYLIKEEEKHLYLNIIDSDKSFDKYMRPMIISALKFIEENILNKKVLVHCNKGQSRSPAIALLFLAKRNKTISDESYQKAKEEFIKIYPFYQPGKGIDNYLNEYWDEIE